MEMTDMIVSSDKDQLEMMGELMNSLSSTFLIFAIIMCLVFVVWFVRRKQKISQMEAKKPVIQRTAFASEYFGVVYDTEEDNTDYLHYALICNGKGEELCRYEEAEGQTIHGFSNENGTLFMHTTETYDDGTQAPVKWMFIPEHNELVECD
ncbi:MAG: hypothetical protein IJZ68_07780 [Bacteroidaceae bacterium]|nr:hypothetical protein [Bacteroidaceae bacterium]